MYYVIIGIFVSFGFFQQIINNKPLYFLFQGKELKITIDKANVNYEIFSTIFYTEKNKGLLLSIPHLNIPCSEPLGDFLRPEVRDIGQGYQISLENKCKKVGRQYQHTVVVKMFSQNEFDFDNHIVAPHFSFYECSAKYEIDGDQATVSCVLEKRIRQVTESVKNLHDYVQYGY